MYLVHGDPVLAEPAGTRLAEALAEVGGCRLVTHRRSSDLESILADLRTFSLFEPAKVVLAVDTAVLADRRAAAGLIDSAAEVVPLSLGEGDELAAPQREAASRLLQALRLFQLDPEHGDPPQLLEQLPKWALQGGEGFRRGRSGRGRGPKQVETLRSDLEGLLAAAREAGLSGRGGSRVAELSEVVQGGLPEGHSLVLVERTVAEDHPLVETLAERRAVLGLGRVEEQRGGGWQGLERLAEELTRQTGVAIDRPGMEELARRTLRQHRERGRGSTGVDLDSTARLAGEYRKLANLARGAGRERIDRQLVESGVEDRGEEDVFELLDAIGEGRGGDALARLERMMASSDDLVATRLTFFALLADYCRRLAAVSGMMQVAGVPAGERSYPRFKSRLAPQLQGDLGAVANPLKGTHPYALHKAYLAASRLDPAAAAELPAWVLETELQLKGESGQPDAALGHLVARVAGLFGR